MTTQKQGKESRNETPVASKAEDATPQNTSDLNSLRVKVAESCGWQRVPQIRDDKFFFSRPEWSDPFWYGKYPRRHVPNYPFDLNACAEFEKMLTKEQLDDYLFRLEQGPRPAALATAEQRCHAFVATMEGNSVQ